MHLFVDIGNTNIKIKFNNHLILLPTKENYNLSLLYSLLPLSLQKSKLTKVWICSVVPKILALFKKMIDYYFKIPIQTINYQLFSQLKLNVKFPKKVGNDLIALGAFAMTQGQNVIIVNLGTATTISHIKQNTLEGVIIAPGLSISLNSLIDEASALSSSPLKLDFNQALGKDTNESISLGVLKGHALMIEGFIKNIDEQAKVIISGGNAKKIINYLTKYTFIEEATLLGLEIIAQKNH